MRMSGRDKTSYVLYEAFVKRLNQRGRIKRRTACCLGQPTFVVDVAQIILVSSDILPLSTNEIRMKSLSANEEA